MKQSYLHMKGITKTFGPVVANDNVDLTVYKGEILAILGENGSGKSTLMNMIAGIYKPDGGTIEMNGKPLHIASPTSAIKAGIGMIHQHFKLVDVLSAADNIILGEEGPPLIDRRAKRKKIIDIADKYGLKIQPDKKVYTMSVSEKQTVEIVKVLYRGADLLILDEPTAVLTPQETRTLFEILRNMKAQNCAVIIITHKLNEVMDISDRVTILRKGKYIGTVDTSDTTTDDLIEMMVGKVIPLDIERSDVDGQVSMPVLEVNNLTVVAKDGSARLRDVSFTMNSGEILGVAGIAGSGQKELCEAIAGLQRTRSGDILLEGQSLIGMTPGDIVKKGVKMGFIPEDRLGMGLVGGMSIVDNVLLRNYKTDSHRLLSRKLSREISSEIIKRYDIQTPSMYHQVKKLSGGNIQKVLLGRELNRNPKILLTAYPVRGLDIGASYQIYDALNEQKKSGVGVMFVGEDLDVLLAISDRVLVLSRGEVMGVLDARTATKEIVGMYMLGKKEEAL